MLLRQLTHVSSQEMATTIAKYTEGLSHGIDVQGSSSDERLFITVLKNDEASSKLTQVDFEEAVRSSQDTLNDFGLGTQVVQTNSATRFVHVRRIWRKTGPTTWTLVLEHINNFGTPGTEDSYWTLEEQLQYQADKNKRREQSIQESQAFRAADDRFAKLALLK